MSSWEDGCLPVVSTNVRDYTAHCWTASLRSQPLPAGSNSTKPFAWLH
ncbi:hypothetical protein T4B_6512 [Trichinella pseudospiralis]|uniref:Uncharacterized protein n=1 Tax=Trichinella pseudospiralis TaxID=6337 RepID=A0A0V0XVI1_TRIPS|nr:hypothetical protein T4E_4742 [Trichinella pseudospiralis]KRZ27575.1 hypothetical protein T4B_6512 [Trichinella pseudospiralis]